MTEEDIVRKMQFADYAELVETSEEPDMALLNLLGQDAFDLFVELAEQEHRRLMETSAEYRRFHARNVIAFHLSLER